MGSVVGELQRLAYLRERTTELSNGYVMAMGELMQIAREALGEHSFEVWVDEAMPFGVDTARRYLAVYLAKTHLPDAPLPPAHRALYAVGYGTMPETRREPCRAASQITAELLRCDLGELSPRLRVALEAWLAGR